MYTIIGAESSWFNLDLIRYQTGDTDVFAKHIANSATSNAEEG